jgi:MFS family permease
LAFLLGGSRIVWMTGFAASSLLMLLHQGPIYAAVMNVARVRMRATATAMLLLCSSLLAQFIGPLLVGWLNDRLAQWYGPFAIRYSMLVLTVCVASAALCFLFAARTLEADTRRAAGDLELPGGAR